MASAATDMNIGPGDISRQVNLFLQGATGSGTISQESLASSALFLLRAVPVARDAVLEHYARAFDTSISSHLAHASQSQDAWTAAKKETTPVDMSTLQDVTGVLLSFIKSNPEAWAPVVSSWALSLLGQISMKYASKQGLQHATSLDEILQMWMACTPAQMLIEITTECFAAMVGGAPDICVDALLEASVRYSPHFDWVVAHIGSCFPRTIITRVLHCGFKDYCGSDGAATDKDMMAGRGGGKVPKMASVVGILGHLASKHSQDIRKALLSLFESSLQTENKVPFLLQLASMSQMLHNILTTDLVAALTPSVLNQLHRIFTRWKSHAPSEYNSFLQLVVHLIYKSNSGAFTIIEFILSTAAPQGNTGSDSQGELPVEEVRDTCVEIVHILLFELQRGVLSRRPDNSTVDIPLLTGLRGEVKPLTQMLLSSTGKRAIWLEKLLSFTSLQSGESCAASVLANILFQANTPQQLAVFYRMKRGVEVGMPDIIESTLVQVFSRLETSAPAQSGQTDESKDSTSAAIITALKNLERIVIVERSKVKRKLISKSPIITCLRERHQILSSLLLSPHPAVTLRSLTLIDMVGFPDHLSLTLLSQLCGTLTLTFFASLHQTSQDNDSKCTRLTQLCMSCIEKLGQQTATRSLLLHYLVDGLMQKENIGLFGGSTAAAWSLSASSSLTSDPVSLVEENRQQSLSIARPRFHSSVYHGGIIRQAGRCLNTGEKLSEEVVSKNCLTLIETIWLCCREASTISWPESKPWGAPAAGGVGGGPAAGAEEPMDTDERIPPPTATPATPLAKSQLKYIVSESGARTLGCAVVEILTLDSLYNDVHWQEPDFRKVTTERDTLVWKRVEEMPVFLSIIQEFSSNCVFLYYVSPVLRSLTAIVMSHLEVSRAPLMSGCPRHYTVATQLVACLTKGSLIIPPLSNVSELFPFVSPYEGYLLLLALWRYIKENPPSDVESEVLKRTCDTSHTSIVHSIIHANVSHMGQLCSRIFNM